MYFTFTMKLYLNHLVEAYILKKTVGSIKKKY